MASERQIAANRRNARKSTGPRSSAGRKRASRNSYRHGLSGGITATVKGAKDIESLARRIAGEGADTAILELARSVAHAEFELVQIRRLKVALIARMSEFGEFEARKPLVTLRDVNRMLTSIGQGLPWDPSPLAPPELPSSERERSAEAVRRALPELVKLDRYERRATARRDRASRQMIARRMLSDNL